MKKNYRFQFSIIAALMFITFVSAAQVLTPHTSTNSIPPSTMVTLCSHAGCGQPYSNYANGYTVIYPSCGGISIDGSFDTESCCDAVYIFDGEGTGGNIIAALGGQGAFNYTASPGQTLTVQFMTDGSVNASGFQFLVRTGPLIEINSGVNQYTICGGTELELNAVGADNYLWDNGFTSSSISVTPMSNVIYTVTGATNAFPACPLSSTISVEVLDSPTVSISGESVRCGNASPITLSADGVADSFVWEDGSTGSTLVVYPLIATTYTVLASNLNGCTDVAQFLVLYSPAPVISIFTSTTAICQGGSTNLFALGADTYTWNNGEQTALVTITPSTGLIYSVIGENGFGCVAVGNQSITVYPSPNVTGNASATQICLNEPVTLTGDGASSYIWMSNALYLSGAQVVAYPQSSTTYSVLGTDNHGCSKMSTLTVDVNACTGVLKNEPQSNLLVYPNPTQGEFTIELGAASEKSLIITDISGRVILNQSTTETVVKVNLIAFADGVYYVRVNSENHTDVIKVVKH